MSGVPDDDVLVDWRDPAKAAATLDMAVGRFAESLDGLRDLLEHIAPHAARLDEEATRQITLEMTGDEADHVLSLLRLARSVSDHDDEGTSADRDGDRTTDVEQPSGAAHPYEPAIASEDASADPSEDRAPDEDDRMGELLSSDSVFQNVFSRALRRHPPPAPRHRLLLNSLVITGVSAFEVLVSKVFQTHAHLHPAVMGQEQVTVAELIGMESVKDAISTALARKADEFLRKSFTGWMGWFREQLRLSPEELAISWETVLEVFERRHALVHHDGRVSRQYLSHVENAPPIGQEISVDDAYVASALDQLFALGFLLGISAMIRLVPDERREAEQRLHDRMYKSMLAGRWTVVESICRVGQTLVEEDARRLVMQANYWLARKRLQGLDAVKEEVELWDVSALSLRYQLGKAALLDDLDQAADIVEELIAREEFSAEELGEWPILEELRGHSRYAGLAALAKEPKPDLNSGESPD